MMILSILFGFVTSLFTSSIFNFNIKENLKLHVVDILIISTMGYFVMFFFNSVETNKIFLLLFLSVLFSYLFFFKKLFFFEMKIKKNEVIQEMSSLLFNKYSIKKKVIKSNLSNKFDILVFHDKIIVHNDLFEKIDSKNIITDIIYFNYISLNNSNKIISSSLFILAVIPFYIGSKSDESIKSLYFIVGGGLVGVSYFLQSTTSTNYKKIILSLSNKDELIKSLDCYKNLLNKTYNKKNIQSLKIEKVLYEIKQ